MKKQFNIAKFTILRQKNNVKENTFCENLDFMRRNHFLFKKYLILQNQFFFSCKKG